MELHGRLEGATGVILMLPHDVADAHLSNLQTLGAYSEALVGLGLTHEDGECKAVGKDLQTFCTSLWACPPTLPPTVTLSVFKYLQRQELFAPH